MFYIRPEVKSKWHGRKCRKVCLVSALIWVISQFQLTKPGIFLSPTHTLQPATELYWFKWFSIRTVLWVFSLRPVGVKVLLCLEGMLLQNGPLCKRCATPWGLCCVLVPEPSDITLGGVCCSLTAIYLFSMQWKRTLRWLAWGRAMQEICSDGSWSVVVVTGNKEIKEV